MGKTCIRAMLVVTFFFPAACGRHSPDVTDSASELRSPLTVAASPSRTLSVAIGQELNLKLGTVGPGEYESPPLVSSPVIHFLDMAFVAPFVPAGPRQQFRFKANGAGQAIIVFRHTGNNPTVSDTVVVR